MLTAIALVPSAPVLVPELATGAAAELQDLSAAVAQAAAELPDRWFVVGVGAADDVIGPGTVGTFGGYGVDVRVALSDRAAAAPRPLPPSVLIAGWVRTTHAPAASAEAWVYAADHTADAALARGRALRAEVEAVPGPAGVLVVADGANTLTASAPGGYDPDSVPVQAALDDALAGGDTDALARLSDAIGGRVAFQVLAGLLGTSQWQSRQLYRGAPYGVGYAVGTWRPR
ncbi:hypothetical protein CIW49_05275 [Mycolicibacterium sp. P1-18]|uniref:hypothetical protein n=1 Tax=Mycolicibacterium sp. P1-18 TaxID=2024615 RepID=UPI0011F18AF8|nr:hypothetical protein [Mycolicibacterium sp. P1-18]KAA0100949.1 hypothetical protein CIW49_05275 [Mycolicibacterium sp. P1-18]